jgi:hypothetical protein
LPMPEEHTPPHDRRYIHAPTRQSSNSQQTRNTVRPPLHAIRPFSIRVRSISTNRVRRTASRNCAIRSLSIACLRTTLSIPRGAEHCDRTEAVIRAPHSTGIGLTASMLWQDSKRCGTPRRAAIVLPDGQMRSYQGILGEEITCCPQSLLGAGINYPACWVSLAASLFLSPAAALCRASYQCGRSAQV